MAPPKSPTKEASSSNVINKLRKFFAPSSPSPSQPIPPPSARPPFQASHPERPLPPHLTDDAPSLVSPAATPKFFHKPGSALSVGLRVGVENTSTSTNATAIVSTEGFSSESSSGVSTPSSPSGAASPPTPSHAASYPRRPPPTVVDSPSPSRHHAAPHASASTSAAAAGPELQPTEDRPSSTQEPSPLGEKRTSPTTPPPQPRPKYKTVTLAVSASCPPSMMRAKWSADDFVIQRQMYNGNISAVFHAVDKFSNITVALKVYKRCMLEDFERLQISREIQLHSALDHESIIGMYAAWKDQYFVYLALEWAPGGDVYAYLKQNGGSISEELVVPLILEPFMSGLNVIHSLGLIHRDIKPENILLTSSFQIKIADFGLSIDNSSEIANTRLGTIDYLAPEVLGCPVKQHPHEHKNNPSIGYTSKVDCWSVGVLTYELLVGKPPFNSSSTQKTLQLIRTKEVAYPSFLSAAAVDFMSSALHRDPNKRFTIEQLLAHPWIQHWGKNRRLSLQSRSRVIRSPTCPENFPANWHIMNPPPAGCPEPPTPTTPASAVALPPALSPPTGSAKRLHPLVLSDDPFSVLATPPAAGGADAAHSHELLKMLPTSPRQLVAAPPPLAPPCSSGRPAAHPPALPPPSASQRPSPQKPNNPFSHVSIFTRGSTDHPDPLPYPGPNPKLSKAISCSGANPSPLKHSAFKDLGLPKSAARLEPHQGLARPPGMSLLPLLPLEMLAGGGSSGGAGSGAGAGAARPESAGQKAALVLPPTR